MITELHINNAVQLYNIGKMLGSDDNFDVSNVFVMSKFNTAGLAYT